MSSIPLPALHLNPPPDPTENFSKLAMLANQLQNAPIQRQALQQQVQAGALENQQKQQALKDQQAVTAAMQEWDGKDFNSLPSLVLKHGGSGQSVIGMKNGLIKQQQDLANLSKDQLDLQAKTNDQLLGHIDAIKGIDDPTRRAQVAQSQAQQILTGGLHKSLDPQSAQMIMAVANGQMVPDDNQLSLFEKGLTAHNSQIEQAKSQAQTQEAVAKGQQAQAEAKKTTMETDFMEKFGGLTQPMADSKYRYLQQQIKLGKPLNQEDQAFVQAYEKQKLLVPIASANVRIAGLGQTREYPVIDTKSGSLQYLSATDLNKANQSEPGRYAPAGEGSKAMGKTALIEDIRGNIQSVRESLNNPKMPEFTAPQRAEIAIALGKPDAQGALSAAFRGGVLGSLSPEQQDYLIAMAQLKENAMAMRSVLGAGQGSEDMRAAITATIPGPRTPSKEFALKQLQAFEAVLNRLERGVPNVPLAPPKGGTQPTGGGNTNTGGGAAKVLSMSQIQKAAKDHGVSVDEAKRQAIAAGYTVQ